MLGICTTHLRCRHSPYLVLRVFYVLDIALAGPLRLETFLTRLWRGVRGSGTFAAFGVVQPTGGKFVFTENTLNMENSTLRSVVLDLICTPSHAQKRHAKEQLV